MPHPPVILVVGPCGHGKTTTREIISQLTELRGASCSDVIYHVLAQRRNVSVDSLRQEPKEALRPALIELGDFLCGQIGQLKEAPVNDVDSVMYRGPSAIIRALYLNGVTVIDGVRRRLELKDAIEKFEWLGIKALVIHVERPGGPKIDDNTESLKDAADECITNDGTPLELREKVIVLLKKYFPASAIEDETPEIVTRASTKVLSAGPVTAQPA